MPTLDEWRAWLRGEEVEALPKRRKPGWTTKAPFDPKLDRAKRMFASHKFPGIPAPKGTKCERCGIDGDEVCWEGSRTMYEWDGEGEDPNREIALCRACAIQHHEYWDEMWNDYYAGRL